MGDAGEETASASYGAVVRHHCAAITAYRNRDKKKSAGRGSSGGKMQEALTGVCERV